MEFACTLPCLGWNWHGDFLLATLTPTLIVALLGGFHLLVTLRHRERHHSRRRAGHSGHDSGHSVHWALAKSSAAKAAKAAAGLGLARDRAHLFRAGHLARLPGARLRRAQQ
jgi:hypothetical protein